MNALQRANHQYRNAGTPRGTSEVAALNERQRVNNEHRNAGTPRGTSEVAA